MDIKTEGEIPMLEAFKNQLRMKKGPILNAFDFFYRKIDIGENLVVYGKIKFFGGKNHSISIGDNVIIRSGMTTNPLGGDTRTILKVTGGFLHIGNNVGITNSCIVSTKGIIIEDNVNIGGDCKLYDSDFHSVVFSERMEFPDTHVQSAPIVIKNGAWIGAHSIILKGVTIGERAVIGAGAVVTKDIPADQVWAGNPAKFIKQL